MSVPEILWPGGPALFQKKGVFPLGMDSILLADFAEPYGAERACDLGTGSGVISILLACRYPDLHIDAVEIQKEAAELAKKNVDYNRLSERINIIRCDLRSCTERLAPESCGLVVSNPPYYQPGEGRRPMSESDAVARAGVLCGIADVCSAARGILAEGGRFAVVYRSGGADRLLSEMENAELFVSRIRYVHHAEGAAPSLVLAEGIRSVKTRPDVLAPFFVKGRDGSDSPEFRRIYHL